MKNPRFLPRLAAGLFTLTAGTLPVLTSLTLTPAAARAQDAAGAQEVSFDFFYNGLAENGDWYNTPDFGYVFQPYIAYKNESWRPYTDGYWAQTDQGWTWVSYEDFGWACYHYGRWSQLENVGWVWVPGYEWGPGWVSWRTSDDYIGWAPLPPKATARVASTTVERSSGSNSRSSVVEEEGRPEDAEEDYDTGYNGGVDVQYDIGPGQYSFVPVQNFGAPYLSEAVVPVAQNVVIIGNTDNVTNIVYRRGPRDNRVIYCGGPDYSYVSRRTERPIPRLLLERRTDVTPDRSGPRADRFNVVRDNRLEFFAPLVSQRAVNFNQVRPARVKENLARPQIVHGWRGAQQQDPGLVDRLRERFQQQARQAPPARQGVENFVTPAAFRAQPPPSIQEQQRLHQPPPPRTREGGDRPGAVEQPPAAVTSANQPPAPPANPGPVTGGAAAGRVNGGRGVPPGPVVAPGLPPGPGGRNLTDAERQARRDARQREFDQRQGNRPGGAAQPVNPPAPPNVANRPGPAAPIQAMPPAPTAPTAPVQPTTGPDRPDAQREAQRAAKQQAREQAAARPAQTPPPAVEGNNPPAPGRPPGQPFQAPPAADPDRAAKREQKRERAAARQEAPPTPTPPTPSAPARENGGAERARQEARGPRVREPQAPPAAQPQQPQQQQQQEALRQQRRAASPEQPREQRRAERPPQPDQAAQQPQAAQQQARAREAQAQQAQRQAAPPRQAPPETRPQQKPPAQPQPQPQPGQNPGEERKKRGDKQGD